MSVTTSSSITNVGGLGGVSPTNMSNRGVLMIEQVKPVIQDATEGRAGTLKSLPKHIIETPWTLKDLCARESLYSTNSWNLAQVWGVPIQSFNVMDSIMQSVGTLSNPFNSMSYFRGTTVLTFKLNGTPFHCGRLIASFYPLQVLPATPNQTDNKSLATMLQHVFLDASTSGSAVMRIPFVHYYSYLPTKAVSTGDQNIVTSNNWAIPGGQVPSLGFVQIQPWQQLQATTGATAVLNYTVTVHMEDVEFFVPSNSAEPFLGSAQSSVVPMPPTQEEVKQDAPVMGAQDSPRRPEKTEEVCKSYRDVLKRYQPFYYGPLLSDTGTNGQLFSQTIFEQGCIFANAVNIQSLFIGDVSGKVSTNLMSKILDMYGLLRGSLRFRFTWEPPTTWAQNGAIQTTTGLPVSFDLRPFVAFLPGASYVDLVHGGYRDLTAHMAPLNQPAALALMQSLSEGHQESQTSEGYLPNYPYNYGTEATGGISQTVYAGRGTGVSFYFMDRNTPYATVEVPFCSSCDSYPIIGYPSIDGCPGVLVVGFCSQNFQTQYTFGTPVTEFNTIPFSCYGRFHVSVSFGDATRAGCLLNLPFVQVSGWNPTGAPGGTYYTLGSDAWTQSTTAPTSPPGLVFEGSAQSMIFDFFQGLVQRLLPSRKMVDALGILNKAGNAIADLDKPGIPISGQYLLRQSMPNYANAEDIEPVNSLALYPSIVTECGIDTFNTSQDEMNLDYLCGKMTYFDNFNWYTTESTGQLIYYCSLSPMPEFLGTGILGTAYVGENIQPSLLSYVSMDFNYWTGGLKYRFQIAPTRFHQGRLFIALTLDDFATPAKVLGMSLAQVSSQYGAYVDLADGVTDFTFEVPYVSRFPRRHVPNGILQAKPQTNQAQAGNGIQSVIGFLSVWIVNPLVAQPGAPTSINITVMQGGASDFELSHLGYNNQSFMIGR